MAVFECLRCGYNWDGKKHNPKACPKCKSYKWNLPNTYGVTEVEIPQTEIKPKGETTDGEVTSS